MIQGVRVELHLKFPWKAGFNKKKAFRQLVGFKFKKENSKVLELFHQPTLMHNFLYSLTMCLLHHYPRHVSSINMPIFRRKNCIHTASGTFALCKRLHSTLVESGPSALNHQIIKTSNYVMQNKKNRFTKIRTQK